MNRNQIAGRVAYGVAWIAGITAFLFLGIIRAINIAIFSALVSFGVVRFILNFIRLSSDPKPTDDTNSPQSAEARQEKQKWLIIAACSAGGVVLGYFMFQVNVSVGSFVFLIGVVVGGYSLTRALNKK